MKNFNLFLAFLVCSSVALVAAPAVTTPVAAASTEAPKTEVKASMFDTVAGYAKAPFKKANGLLNTVNAELLKLEKAAASKVSANTPAVPAVVSTTTSNVFDFIANNQVTLVLAAAATYGVYAYATSNSADKKSKN